KRFAVVAPSRRMAARLQRLLALEKGLALMGVRFHTFHSLALELVEESGREHERLVTDGLFHDKIIDRLLARRLKGRRLARGLASAFRSSIRDLVDCGLTPEGFRESFGERISELRHADRLRQVLALQEDYLEALKKAAILPPSGLARLAIEILGDTGETALGRYSELLYYGFYDLTGSQADFFEAVRQNSSVTLFYPYRKGHPAFEFAKRFYEQNAGHAKPVHLEAGVETRALGPSLDAFGSPESRAGLPRPEALTVISASGAADEVWAAAKEILALVKGTAKAKHGEQALSFDDIGVVARTLEPYRSEISAVFKENAIPFSMSSPEPLLRHPAAKLLLNVLQLGRREFPVSTVMDLAGSPYFKADSY
ncbi:MAG: exodeoxyribonuclease V subunit gamma, partial [Elusimicrobia bacterium]|nr:exodeoxyribonuclease V subunit gamma [Elusimicrobiota bacterium]